MVLHSCSVHWTRWKSLTLPKQLGGIGFRDLKIFNLSSFAKQGWRLLNFEESLEYKVLKSRYFPNGSFLSGVKATTLS